MNATERGSTTAASDEGAGRRGRCRTGTSRFRRTLERGRRVAGGLDRVWTVLSFLAVVVQLALIRGFDLASGWVFVAPVLFALAVAWTDAPSPGRTLGRWFLTAVGFGLALSSLPWLMPDLGGVDRRLTPERDRALAWYAVVHVSLGLVVLPVHLFRTELHRHRNGDATKLSKFTCRLGLVAVTLAGPVLVPTTMSILGVFPLVG